MVGSFSQDQDQFKRLPENASRFTGISVSQEEGRLHRIATQEERETPRSRRPLYRRGAATQGEGDGGEVREEPPDPDLSTIGEGEEEEEEISHRDAPLTRPLPRTGLHCMSDSDTEVEVEWKEVERRRNRRERRHRHQTDGENNHNPVQREKRGSSSMFELDVGPPSPSPSLASVSLLAEAEELQVEEEGGVITPLEGVEDMLQEARLQEARLQEGRLQEALNVALGVAIETERVSHPHALAPAPAPTPAPTEEEHQVPLVPEDEDLPDPAAGEEELDLHPFLNAVVPRALPPHPEQEAGEGWAAIDRLSGWDCFLSEFGALEEVPKQHRPLFGWAMGTVFERILDAYAGNSDLERERALKWFLFLAQALLRTPCKGGQSGRGLVAGRFHCLVERRWGKLVRLWEEDRAQARKEARVHREAGTLVEEEDRRKRNSIAQLGKGNVSKCMNLLTSNGVADLNDPLVRLQVETKHPPRRHEIQNTVVLKSPVDNLKGLREALLNLRRKKGSSPGAGGCRMEYLVTLGEVLEADRMQMFEDVCLLYLQSRLDPWFYRVFLTTRTVALYKDETQGPVRPLGIRHPLPRALGSMIMSQSKPELEAFFLPQQLAFSKGGCFKLYVTMRMRLEEGPHTNVLVKWDKENAFNSSSRARAVKVYSQEPTLSHLASHAATTLASSTALEDRGRLWGEGEEGFSQGDPRAGADYCAGTQEYLVKLDLMVRRAGGQALALYDDGYVYGPPDVVFPAMVEYEEEVWQNCGLRFQRSKCEVFSWSGELPAHCPRGFKLAGDVISGRFEPGLMVVVAPLGSDNWVKSKMQMKMQKVEKVTATLGEEKQAMWTLLRSSFAHKRGYSVLAAHALPQPGGGGS